jgi:hypothetical protein
MNDIMPCEFRKEMLTNQLFSDTVLTIQPFPVKTSKPKKHNIMAVKPITVTVAVPEEIREHKGKCTYKISQKVRLKVHYGVLAVDPPTTRFFQKQSMKDVEATIAALEELECSGEVSVLIASGIVQVEANLNVITEACKSIAEGALESVVQEAKRLQSSYPGVEFTLLYSIETKFHNIVHKP